MHSLLEERKIFRTKYDSISLISIDFHVFSAYERFLERTAPDRFALWLIDDLFVFPMKLAIKVFQFFPRKT